MYATCLCHSIILIICISLLACAVSQPQEGLQCKWSTCGVDVSECPAEYPFRLESSACLQPDGVRCSGVSSLCCQTKSSYQPYWVGEAPNCLDNCDDCNSYFNITDFCYGFTRICDGSGNVCEFGSQILCGQPGGSLKLDRGIILVINFVSRNTI